MSNNISILLETDDFLVINKPAALMVHSNGKTKELTLTDWILEKYPEMKGVGEPMKVLGSKLEVESMSTEDEADDLELRTSNSQLIDRPGIVHRLDEETSGALLIAKTPEAFAHFKQQFMERTIKKEYHAFVWGHFKEGSGVVDAAIGRSPSDFRRRLAGRGMRGEAREAVTRWQAIRQFSDESGQDFSFMHLYPQTGRTHQLRVHMKHLQRPIVSDHLYASDKPDALGFTRLALHARKISFSDLSGTELSVEAPYPSDFDTALARYGKA